MTTITTASGSDGKSMHEYQLWMLDADIEALLGPKIGRGTGRNCYRAKDDEAVVIKEVHIPFYGSNMTEWIIWHAVKDTALANVFGSCVSISFSGRYLIMERLDDITSEDYRSLPDVPAWVTDVKPDSFGKNASGQFKIRDYAHVVLGETLATAPRQRRVWMNCSPYADFQGMF